MLAFRNDIQILRGFAVILVVLYHLGAPGFSHGYLGVDVFFVISGYLMSRLYEPGKARAFYGKRARRLLPAYFVTIAATVLTAAVVCSPNEFREAERQSIFSVALIPNVGLWLQNSYFEKDIYKPLLHLWSLGVEIQFYLLVPLYAWLARRFRWASLAVGLATALGCAVMVSVSPKTAFFMLPFRIWEFLIGFHILANHPASGNATTWRQWIGPVLLAVAIFAPWPPSADTLNPVFGHPGLAAALACLGTGAIVNFGLPLRSETWPPFRLVKRVGDASYSIYLAHFPVIALFLYQPFRGTRLAPDSAAEWMPIAFLIAALSALLFFAVERPMRHRSVTYDAACAGMTALSIGLAALISAQATPDADRKIYAAAADRDTIRCGKIFRILHPTALSCPITADPVTPRLRVLLVGNSHADSIKLQFAEEAERRQIAVRFIVPNDPLLPGGPTVERLLAEIVAHRIDALVLHYSPRSLDVAVLKRLATAATKQGIPLSYLLPVPVWQDSVPKMMIEAETLHAPPPHQTRADYTEANRASETSVREIDAPGFAVYATADDLCRESCRYQNADGRPLYFDSDHLTLSGAHELAPVFDRILDDLLANTIGIARAAP